MRQRDYYPGNNTLFMFYFHPKTIQIPSFHFYFLFLFIHLFISSILSDHPNKILVKSLIENDIDEQLLIENDFYHKLKYPT